MIVISILIICATALSIQWSYFYHKKSERDHVDAFRISEALEEKLKDLADLKKQVDVLNLRAGFSNR